MVICPVYCFSLKLTFLFERQTFANVGNVMWVIYVGNRAYITNAKVLLPNKDANFKLKQNFECIIMENKLERKHQEKKK